MRTLPSRRVAALAALLVLTTVAAACSSSASDAKGPSSFDPKVAAKKLRALGAVTIEGRGSYGEQHGPISGTIGYSPYRSRVRVSVSTGQILGQGTLVRVGEDAWFNRRVITAGAGVVPIGLGTLTFRGKATPPYVQLQNLDQPFAAYLIYPFDPAALLDRIARTKAHFDGAGSSDVDGTARKRFRAKLSVADARRIGVQAVTVWVDAKGVPVQLAFPTAAQGDARYTVTRHRGRVDVQPPPASAVQVTNRPLPDATGPYTEVMTAMAGSIPIRVLEAPAELDWTCWKVESDPPFQGQNDVRPSGGTCAVPVTPGGQPDDQFAIPLGTTGDAPYTLLGIVVPAGSTVEFRRFDGDPVTVTAGPSGLALYAGPRTDVLGLATITTPDTKLVCGPGDINNEADFVAQQNSGARVDDLRGAPWNCAEADIANSLSG